MLTLGVVTDLHFGPQAGFDGKLRKLTGQAPALTRAFAARMRELEPDLVVNLGDDIEDEAPQIDAERYRECLGLLAESGRELVHVAGNHDRIHLSDAALRRAWGMAPDGPLYRSFDRGRHHVVVLATHERKDRDVRIDDAQLTWLETDLSIHAEQPVVVLMHHSAAEQRLEGNRWFENRPHLCLVEERRRLRELLERHGDVRLVLNGHLHWNHLAVHGSIPYVTLQSLVENVEDDAPGRAAAAHAVVCLSEHTTHVEIHGAEPCRYQLDR